MDGRVNLCMVCTLEIILPQLNHGRHRSLEHDHVSHMHLVQLASKVHMSQMSHPDLLFTLLAQAQATHRLFWRT